MSLSRSIRAAGLIALLAAVGACGGGGGGGEAGLDAGGTTPTGGAESSSPFEQVVVLYDVTGDDLPDLVTLDRTTDPMTIREALVATDAGDSLDRTDLWKGRSIDAEVSRTLAAFLADSTEIASRRRIDVVESGGRKTTVTVYE